MPEYEKMTVKELKVHIRKHNLTNAIKGYSTMRKSQLVEALKKHEGASMPAAKMPMEKKKNEWLSFVKTVALRDGLTYRNAMKVASKEYHK